MWLNLKDTERSTKAGLTHWHWMSSRENTNTVQDAGGEVDVQVAEENDAAGILGAAGRAEPRPPLQKGAPAPAQRAFPVSPTLTTHLYCVHSSLQPRRALKVPGSPQVLVSGRRDEWVGSHTVASGSGVGGRKTHLYWGEGEIRPTLPEGSGGAATWAAAQRGGPAPRPCPRSQSPPGRH